jgi:hypothetical protein
MANSTGPLISKNNLKGFQVAELTLVNTTAQTWTHNFGAIPVSVACFSKDSGAALLPAQAVITTNANAIVCTPNASVNARLFISWDYNMSPQGLPATNFV